jgi:16S rRNA (cytidine1402-2'-O)-methyltransferase
MALTIVPTPIGNLGDITRRAVEALRAADLVLAEDTRRTRALLTHLGIEGKTVVRLDAHVEERQAGRWVDALVAGQALALCTDAGTPSLSDPGAVLVQAAAARGLPVVALPGASAITTALSCSGFPADRFRFVGFLPRSGGARRAAVARIAQSDETVVLFEAPARASRTLADLAAATPGRPAMVARELTKLHEELVRGTLCELAALEREWRGEITMVLGPHRAERVEASAADVDRLVDAALDKGLAPKEAARQVAREAGLRPREVYQRLQARRRGTGEHT